MAEERAKFSIKSNHVSAVDIAEETYYSLFASSLGLWPVYGYINFLRFDDILNQFFVTNQYFTKDCSLIIISERKETHLFDGKTWGSINSQLKITFFRNLPKYYTQFIDLV